MYFAATEQESAALRSSRGLEEIEQPVFLYDRKVEGSSEVFRIGNPATGGVLYTASPEEKEDDLRLESRRLGWGRRIVFSSANAKVSALLPGDILYSEKSPIFPLGLVARVVSVSVTESGETEVETDEWGTKAAPYSSLPLFSWEEFSSV